MLRLFVAVNLSPVVNQKIAAFCDPALAVSWVRPEDYHVTLKFLGAAPEEALPAIKAELKKNLRFLPFKLLARGAGTFPESSLARVIWVGIEGGGSNMQELAAGLETGFETLGFAREKRAFVPHLTVARLNPAADLGAFVERSNGVQFGESHVTELILYESKAGGDSEKSGANLLPGGARYKPLVVLRAPGLC